MNTLKDKYRQLKSGLGMIGSTLALVAALPRFLRDPITVQRAEEEIKRLLHNRVDRFLELIRTQVYERPGSVCLRLLKHAGCEFSDLQTHVHRHGLEATLGKLAKEGVFLTSDEFKGKRVKRTWSVEASCSGFLPWILTVRSHHRRVLSFKAVAPEMRLLAPSLHWTGAL
jgi:hypothetical protein